MKSIVKHIGTILLIPITAACANIMEEDRVATDVESTVTRAESVATMDYYWLGEEKIPLQKMDNKFYVMYDSAIEEKFRAELTKTGTAFAEVQDNDLSQYADIKSFDAIKFAGLKTATI